MTVPTRLVDKQAQDLANKIGEIFTSLPHLPKNIVEFLVKLAPIFALIGAILSLFAGPVLGFLGALSLLALNPLLVLSTLVAAVLSICSAVVLFLAYKPLQNKEYVGWMLLFWSNMFGAAETIISIIFRQNSFFGLIGIVIGFYVLYEMRPFYGMKGKMETLKTNVKELTQ